MDSPAYSDGLPIYALASPFSESALCLIRVGGKGSLKLLAAVFSRPDSLVAAPSGQALHGWLHRPGTPQDRIDEVVVLAWRPPSGYTGEEGADIMGHGSLSAITACLETLQASGFRQALPGEFSLRAFLNGKIDLTRAEAVGELIASRTEKARSDAVTRLSGNLAQVVETQRKALLSALAQVHVQLDYALEDDVADMGLPRSELEAVLAALRSLAGSYFSGRLYREGARVALAGRTNSGKSSLFNLFLKEDRAIVSEVHGTTRDYLEAWIDLEGLPLLLYDTAGFRLQADAVEKEGMERSLRVLSGADIVLYLVDSERGLSPEDHEFLGRAELAGRIIPLWSRADKAGGPAPSGFISLSMVNGRGFSELGKAILTLLFAGQAQGPREDGLHIASARQKALVDRAIESLAACLNADARGESLDATEQDLREALDALSELTGERASPDILHEIFSRFCVGK